MKIERLTAEHFKELSLQPRQAYLGPELRAELAGDLAEAGPAFAATVGGRVIAAGGLLRYGYALPVAWALLGSDIGHRFTILHRAVIEFLERSGTVQTGIEPDHAEGHRWARMLGFAHVGPWTEWQSTYGREFDRWVRQGASHGP